MRKFIEVEMEKVKGTAETEEEEDEGPKYLSPEDAALQVGHLTISQSHNLTISHWQQFLSSYTQRITIPRSEIISYSYRKTIAMLSKSPGP